MDSTTCDYVSPTIAHGRVPCIHYLVHKEGTYNFWWLQMCAHQLWMLLDVLDVIAMKFNVLTLNTTCESSLCMENTHENALITYLDYRVPMYLI